MEYPQYIVADSRKLAELVAERDIPKADLIITSPPYYDVKNYDDVKYQIGQSQRYEEYIKKRHRILDSFAESLLKSYEQDGHQLRMNIMLAKPYILRSLEPSKKKPNVTALHLWGKLFKFNWTKNMVFHGKRGR